MERTRRLRLSGAIVAAFLALMPLMGMSMHASAQGSGDPKGLLSDAQALTNQLTPVVNQDSFTITQSADKIASHSLGTDPIQDFYLEFTVEAPRDGAKDPFDFGLFFRDAGSDYYGLAVSSDAGGNGPAWGLILAKTGSDPKSVDSGDLAAKDFPTATGSTYDVVVAAMGGDAAFSVNGTAVAQLDVSALTDGGAVSLASGFFSSSSVAGDKVSFSNVTLYDLNAAAGGNGGNGGNTQEASPTPESGNGGNSGGQTEGRPTPTSEAGSQGNQGGNVGYTSPDYGYTLSFDNTWTIADQSSKDGNDYVNLTNGASTVLIFGQAYTGTAQACVESDIKYFQDTTNGYTFDGVATDKSGQQLTGELGGNSYYAVLWVTDKNGAAQTIYVECRPIVAGKSMMLIEQYTADADYNNEIAARKALLDGLVMEGANNSNTSNNSGNSGNATNGTPTATSGSSTGNEIDVTLDAVQRSGVSGDAVLTPSGSARTKVVVTSDSAPEGALVVLQKGSCDSLSGNPDLEAGAIDANGESSSRVKATLDELSGNYAVTIIDPNTEDYATPLACGDI